MERSERADEGRVFTGGRIAGGRPRGVVFSQPADVDNRVIKDVRHTKIPMHLREGAWVWRGGNRQASLLTLAS